MRVGVHLFLASLALIGCTNGTEPVDVSDAIPANGERLRANTLLASDGSRQFLNWFDTVRGEDCSFGLASDGTTRCLPAAAPVSTTLFGPGGDCDRPIVVIPICQFPEEVPKYAAKPVGCGSALGPLILHVTEKLAPNELREGTFGLGNCAAAQAPKGFDFYATGSSVPPTEFVQAVAVSD